MLFGTASPALKAVSLGAALLPAPARCPQPPTALGLSLPACEMGTLCLLALSWALVGSAGGKQQDMGRWVQQALPLGGLPMSEGAGSSTQATSDQYSV